MLHGKVKSRRVSREDRWPLTCKLSDDVFVFVLPIWAGADVLERAQWGKGPQPDSLIQPHLTFLGVLHK